MDHELIETLRNAQRLGFFGAAPIETAIEHAEAYVAAIGNPPPGARLADLGSGGGLPGLVLAVHRPELDIVLIDRRQKRTDFLERAVARLELDHVTVWCRDAGAIARSVESGDVAPFDIVTARGFGPPEPTLTLARRLLGSPAAGRSRGVIVISEPPTGDRWDPALLGRLGLSSERLGPVRRFVLTD